MPRVTLALITTAFLISCGGYSPPGNYPPDIQTFSVQPDSGYAPLSITVNCYATDRDGLVVNYLFDFDGDGTTDARNRFGIASGVLGKPGTYQTSCTAVDDLGARSTKVQEVVVTDPLRP